MRQGTLLKIFAAAALVGSCASAAMITPAEESRPAEETGMTLTPVVVDTEGRMTAPPEPVRAADASSVRSRAARTSVPVEAVPAEPLPLETAEGEATYYASKFDGRRSASGVVFRNSKAYAAHRTYPFGTVVRVTNLVNGRSVIVEVIDRGPHGSSARAKRTIIDLSQSVARELDFMRAGRVPVRVEVLEWGAGRT